MSSSAEARTDAAKSQCGFSSSRFSFRNCNEVGRRRSLLAHGWYVYSLPRPPLAPPCTTLCHAYHQRHRITTMSLSDLSVFSPFIAADLVPYCAWRFPWFSSCFFCFSFCACVVGLFPRQSTAGAAARTASWDSGIRMTSTSLS